MECNYEFIRSEVDKLINKIDGSEHINFELNQNNYEFKNVEKINVKKPKLILKFAGYKLYFNRRIT